MSIEPENIGKVVGRNSSNVNRLQKKYDVKISFPAKGSSQIISIEGLAENVSAAKTNIEQSLTTATFLIKKEYKPWITRRTRRKEN